MSSDTIVVNPVHFTWNADTACFGKKLDVRFSCHKTYFCVCELFVDRSEVALRWLGGKSSPKVL